MTLNLGVLAKLHSCHQCKKRSAAPGLGAQSKHATLCFANACHLSCLYMLCLLLKTPVLLEEIPVDSGAQLSPLVIQEAQCR